MYSLTNPASRESIEDYGADVDYQCWMDLNQRIRKARDDIGMTQDELAHAVGKTRGAVSQWESGEVRPRHSTIKEIAKVTGKPLAWLESGIGKEAIGLMVIGEVAGGVWKEGSVEYIPKGVPVAPHPDYPAEAQRLYRLFGFRCGMLIMDDLLRSVESLMATGADFHPVARRRVCVSGQRKPLGKHSQATFAQHQRLARDGLLKQGLGSQSWKIVPSSRAVEVLHEPVSALGVRVGEAVVEVVEHLQPLALDGRRQLVEFEFDGRRDCRLPLVKQPLSVSSVGCLPDRVETLLGLPTVFQKRVVVEQALEDHETKWRQLFRVLVHDRSALVRVAFQRSLGRLPEPASDQVERHVGLAENVPLVHHDDGVRQQLVDHLCVRPPHICGDDPHAVAVRHPRYPVVNGRLQHGVNDVEKPSIGHVNEHSALLLADGQFVDAEDDDRLLHIPIDNLPDLLLTDIPHGLVVHVHVPGYRAVALHHALLDDVFDEATGHPALAVHGRKALHRGRAALSATVSDDLGADCQRLSERRNVLVIHHLSAVPIEAIDRPALRAVPRICVERRVGNGFVRQSVQCAHRPSIQPECIVCHGRPSFGASHIAIGLSCGVYPKRGYHKVDGFSPLLPSLHGWLVPRGFSRVMHRIVGIPVTQQFVKRTTSRLFHRLVIDHHWDSHKIVVIHLNLRSGVFDFPILDEQPGLVLLAAPHPHMGIAPTNSSKCGAYLLAEINDRFKLFLLGALNECFPTALRTDCVDQFGLHFPHDNPNRSIACYGLFSTRKSEYPLYQVRGNSVNRQIPDGEYAHCVKTDGGAIQALSGDLVIVRRASHGMFEYTAKRYLVENGKHILRPESDDSAWQDDIVIDGDEDTSIEITDVIVAKWKPLRRGF